MIRHTNAVMLDAPGIYLADAGIALDISREAMLEMVDATTNPPTAATVMQSTFQTNTVAIRCEQFVTWVVAVSNAVQHLVVASQHTGESWMRHVEALGRDRLVKTLPADESDDAFYARVERAKHVPARRREGDPAIEADALRMDAMIEADLANIEQRVLRDLIGQGASPEVADEHIRAAIALLRAGKRAWQDRILARLRGGRG